MMSAPSVVASAAAAAASDSSGSLLSGIIAQLWSHINVALAESVRETVEPTFKESLPGPLSTLRFTQLDLGTVPIRMDNTIVHEIKDGVVQFDVDIVWDGDCSIELTADYIGSFGVKALKLHGRMSVLLAPLTNSLPVVSAVQYGFINPPLLELDFTGLANVADFGMVDKKIRGIIHDTLAGMMVLPNRMLFKMDPANSFLDTYRPPVGVVRVTLQQGSGFEAAKKGLMHDVNDVYCTITFGSSLEWQSSTKNNSISPEWNESKDFVLFDHDQVIKVRAWDEDTLDSDDDLGSAQVTVREMLLAGKTVKLDLHGSSHKGASVTLHCDTCMLAPNAVEEDDKKENRLAGLLTILITRAFDIPLDEKDASSFVKVKYGSEHEFVSGTVVHAPGIDALNPVYDCAFHVPLSYTLMDKKETLEFQLINGEDSVLGSFGITHNELLNAADMTVTDQRKIGDGGASLEFRALLGLVQLPSESFARSTAAVISPTHSSIGNALGKVRLTVAKGWGFEEEKRRFKRNDVPDVYCNITFGSSPKIWRTPTIKNSTTPEWNVSADYALLNHGQIITISAFDEDKGGRDKDDDLGSARVNVGKLLLASDLVDVELQKAGKPTGLYISLRGDIC